MAVDFSTVFQNFYPPGPGRVYVAPGGSGNGSSQGSPLGSILAGVNALGSAGGIVYCADGAYGTTDMSGRYYSANGWCLIMAKNYLGATISTTSGNAFHVTGGALAFGQESIGKSVVRGPGLTRF